MKQKQRLALIEAETRRRQQQLLMKMEVVMFDFVCSQPLLIVLVCAQVKYGEVDGEK